MPISWPGFTAITAGLCFALFLAIFLSGGPRSVVAKSTFQLSDQEYARFGQCDGLVQRNCVVDGDTFWYLDRKIRIADINTAELTGAQCASERRLALQAKDRLQILLNDGAFSLQAVDREQDRYGRDLRIVTRRGSSIGGILVDEGLAERWRGYRRDWCSNS